MKNSHINRKFYRVAVLGIALCALAAFSMAKTGTRATKTGTRATATTSTSVNIVNNSSREIRNVYLSHVNVDDWSNDQLSNDATIGAGQSHSLSDIACDAQQVKVIAEDADGCFLSTVVNCGDSATWTISNDTTRDCGGGI